MAQTLTSSRPAPSGPTSGGRRPRRAGTAVAVALAHVALLAGLLSIPGVRPEATRGESITVALVPPPAATPSPVPPRVAVIDAPDPIPVQFAPSPIEIPAIAPPSAAPANAPVVVTVARTSAPDVPPTVESVSYVREPEVRYPPLSRRMKEQGLVVVRVLIGADGRAAEVEVQRSSGFARLDAAACEAVRHAEFRPYLVQGRAVAATALVPIEFSLSS